ncbi:MAG: DUF2092 domain-containing protein [Luteimonas sp.]
MARKMTDRPRFGVLVSGVLLAMVATASASAQDAATPDAAAPAATTPAAAPASSADTSVLQSQGVITPEAQAVLDRMQASFRRIKRFELSADITRDEVLSFGYKLQHNESARMWVDAPKNLRLEVNGDIKNRVYVYDGSQLTMAVPDMNVYATTPAPATLRELVTLLLDAGVEMPLIDMLYQGNDGNLTDDVRVGLVVGDSQLDGVATDHLAFRQPNVDWQLWVEKGENALPRKLLITTRYAVGDPQYQAILHWDLTPKMDAKAFAYVPPSGATKIPFHSNFLARGGDK